MINKKWTLSDASYAQCLFLQKKPIVDQLLKDLSESKDLQKLLPYWRSEKFLFQPKEWYKLYHIPGQLKKRTKEKLKIFIEHRKVNLKIHHPEITESNLLESVYSLMKKIVTNFAIANTDDYLEFW